MVLIGSTMVLPQDYSSTIIQSSNCQYYSIWIKGTSFVLSTCSRDYYCSYAMKLAPVHFVFCFNHKITLLNNLCNNAKQLNRKSDNYLHINYCRTVNVS